MVKKISTSKKGTESEMWVPTDFPIWIISGIVLGFAAIFFVIIISTSQSEVAVIKANLEEYFLAARILRSPKCLAAEDADTRLIHSGTLDYEKFNDLNLDSCMYGLARDNVALKLTLGSDAALPDLPKSIFTSNWNDNRPIEKKERIPIVVMHSGNFYNAGLTIEMQNVKK
ncbi:hypothetical protein HYS31_00485 [Candidatus Woesearchaeota archaeon]|nr:hypothetical protein [Candidatus Woesearchaeota archaeon]